MSNILALNYVEKITVPLHLADPYCLFTVRIRFRMDGFQV
jgi:hypothetical protein